MAKRGRPTGDGIGLTADLVDDFIEQQDRALSGIVQHHQARKEWSNTAQDQFEDVTIEEMLSSDMFFGKFNMWPSVQESMKDIWHRRYDHVVEFWKKDHEGGRPQLLHEQEVYALNHLHAQRKAKRQCQTVWGQADYADSRRLRPCHSVVYEMPRGSGKDFEMSIMIVALCIDLMRQREDEFYGFYNLDPGTRISVNLMNRTEPLSKRVTFAEVMPKFNIPFILDYFPPANVSLQKAIDEKDQPGELRLPRNIVVFPGTGASSSNLGYALVALVMDECNNFPKVQSQGQLVTEGTDVSGDIADDVYLDGIRRIESRLGQVVRGKMETWGMVIAISQSRTSMDFTKKMETLSLSDPGIVYRSHAFWDRKPLNLCGESFEFDTRSLSIIDLQGARSKAAQLGITDDNPVLEQD